MGERGWGRWLRRGLRLALATLVAAAAGWQLWPLVEGTTREVAAAGHLDDDAFFYSVLVDHVRRYGFFTLDGEMPTNGFQPLWMLSLLGLKTVASGVDSATLLRWGIWSAWVGFAGATTWLVAEGRVVGAVVRAALVAGLLLLNHGIHDAMVNGLEVPLTLLVLVGTLLVVRRLAAHADARPLGARRAAALGVLAALCFLGRTDLFWWVGILGLWCWWIGERRRTPALAYGAGAGALVLPYLGWNLLTHGDLVPVSGRVKLHYLEVHYPTAEAYWNSREWKGLFSLFETWLPSLEWSTAVATTIALLAALVAWTWTPSGRRRVPVELRLLGATVLLHALYMQLVHREVRPYTSYYFAPEALFAVTAVAYAVTAIPSRAGAIALACYLLLTTTASWRAFELNPSPYWTTRLEVADRLRSLSRKGDIGAFWPGAFAEFSGAPVTPLDGIIGSNRYFEEYVRPGRPIQYVLDEGIDYVVSIGGPDELLRGGRPRAGLWSERGKVDIWENREHFEAVFQRGPWTILKRKPDAS